MKRLLPIALLALIACGGGQKAPPAAPAEAKPAAPPPPNAAAAQAIVGGSPELGEFEFTNAAVSLPMSRAAMNEPALAAAKDLVGAGWLVFDGDAVVLSAKSRGDKRFLVRPNGFLDVVPLAKKEMGEVTAVRPTEEGVDVDFKWKWISNDVGSAIASGPIHERYATEHRATATLIHDGTSWIVLRIRAAGAN
jgi:hypothetical protein